MKAVHTQQQGNLPKLPAGISEAIDLPLVSSVSAPKVKADLARRHMGTLRLEISWETGMGRVSLKG